MACVFAGPRMKAMCARGGGGGKVGYVSNPQYDAPYQGVEEEEVEEAQDFS